jgi:hypothetical protein
MKGSSAAHELQLTRSTHDVRLGGGERQNGYSQSRTTLIAADDCSDRAKAHACNGHQVGLSRPIQPTIAQLYIYIYIYRERERETVSASLK